MDCELNAKVVTLAVFQAEASQTSEVVHLGSLSEFRISFTLNPKPCWNPTLSTIIKMNLQAWCFEDLLDLV